MSSNTNTLYNLFKNCLNTLRDNEHLIGDKALRNLSYLLILKLLEPRFDHQINIDTFEYPFHLHFEGDQIIEKYKTKLLSIVRFSALCQEKEEDIPSLIKLLWDVILSEHPATKHIFLKHKGFDIVNKSTFKTLLEHLSSIDLSNTEYDVLGEAYEDVIKDEMTGKVLGQYFTPPVVKNIMIELIQPKLKSNGTIEKIFDPAMGTGGFLISSLRHVIEQSQQQSISLDWTQISQEGLGGREIESDTYQLAVSNMLISSGLIFDGVEKGDSIRNPITNKYDVIITNPPFGISGLKYDDFDSGIKSEYLPIKSNNAVSLFIQAIIYMLELNGRCAIVLPDGKDLFSKTDKGLMMVREYLMKSCNVKEIIYMPSGIFTHTSINTCICYFEKKCTDCLAVDIKVSKSNKETRNYQFSTEHQTDKIRFYEWKENEKKFLTEVDIKSISDNAYSLNYVEYMEKKEDNYSETVIIKKLSEACIFNIGGTPLRKKPEYYNGTNLWVSVKELNGGYIYDTKEKITDLGVQKSSVKKYQEGTVLFSFKLSIGKTAIVGKELYSNEAIAGIISRDTKILMNKYLYYYLTITDFSKLGSGILGNGSLNKKSLEEIDVPIPSIKLQQKLVEYLDFIYEHSIKTSEKKITEFNTLNKHYINNYTLFDCSIKQFSDIAHFMKKSKRKASEGQEQGKYSFFTSSQSSTKYIDVADYDTECIIIGTGGTANVKYSDMFSCSADNFVITFDESCNTKYVYYYLLYNLSILQKGFVGIGLQHISKEYINGIQIPIPTMENQKKIVEYCENNNKLIQLLRTDIKNNTQQAHQFLNNILS
tara:strand:- start:412 stop:2868 length:2457 start_codon:yes stop_codon:yes gene_type:complete